MATGATPWWGVVLAAFAVALVVRSVPAASGDNPPRTSFQNRVEEAWTCLLLAVLAAVALPLLLGLTSFRIWRVPIEIMLFALVPIRQVREIRIAWFPPGPGFSRWGLPIAAGGVWCGAAAIGTAASAVPMVAASAGMGLAGVLTVVVEAFLFGVFYQNFLQETLLAVWPAWVAGCIVAPLWTVLGLVIYQHPEGLAALGQHGLVLLATGAAAAYAWHRHRSLWTAVVLYALTGATQIVT